MGPTILFTHLKIILLQCFQFSVFSFQFSVFSNNKLNPNGPIIEQFVFLSALRRETITTSRCGTTGRWLLMFHHISCLSSHEDCNCNFWKSQKPIEPGVCVGSEFPSSSSSWWYPWTYPTVSWGIGQWLPHASLPPFFFSQKKEKKKEKL